MIPNHYVTLACEALSRMQSILSLTRPFGLQYVSRTSVNHRSGAREGITGKSGERPVRSRHCK